MAHISRRSFGSAVVLACLLCSRSARAAGELQGADPEASEWLDKLLPGSRTPGGPLRLGRFKDPIYFLTSPISWAPNPEQAKRLTSVVVPSGFVTDLTSIPRIFWSALRPDGDYAYAAILHDYLYWAQKTSRADADDLLLVSMQEFGIEDVTSQVIYQGVKNFGERSWKANAAAKVSGEKRILRRWPSSPLTTWAEWKADAGNFL